MLLGNLGAHVTQVERPAPVPRLLCAAPARGNQTGEYHID